MHEQHDDGWDHPSIEIGSIICCGTGHGILETMNNFHFSFLMILFTFVSFVKADSPLLSESSA
jgi:hypothetical protein